MAKKYLFIMIMTLFYSFETQAKDFSFEKEPYIHPFVIKLLKTPVADNIKNPVLSIDLLDAQQNNQNILIKTEHKKVYAEKKYDDEYLYFSYEIIGKIKPNIYILKTIANFGGSGNFTEILFIKQTNEVLFKVDENANKLSAKEHLILRTLGSVNLGDRWIGELKLEGNLLTVGENRSQIKNIRDKYPSKIYELNF